jgi:GTP cyclohydrolase I
MAEVILRSKDWVMAFDDLISRLRDDLRDSRIDLPPTHRFEMSQAVVEFLKAAGQQAKSLGVYETPTVIDRTAKIWKTLADEAR